MNSSFSLIHSPTKSLHVPGVDALTTPNIASEDEAEDSAIKQTTAKKRKTIKALTAIVSKSLIKKTRKEILLLGLCPSCSKERER